MIISSVCYLILSASTILFSTLSTWWQADWCLGLRRVWLLCIRQTTAQPPAYGLVSRAFMLSASMFVQIALRVRARHTGLAIGHTTVYNQLPEWGCWNIFSGQSMLFLWKTKITLRKSQLQVLLNCKFLSLDFHIWTNLPDNWYTLNCLPCLPVVGNSELGNLWYHLCHTGWVFYVHHT